MDVTKSVLIIFAVILSSEAARILGIFPTPSISHQVVFRPIVQELARRGHQVTVLTPDPAFPKGKTPANLKEIDVHDLSYEDYQGWLEENQGSHESFIKQIKKVFTKITVVLEKQINVPEFKKLYNETFDLILIESYVRPALGLAHVFDAPVIHIASLGTGPAVYNAYGAPSHPLLYPSAIAQRLYNLTMLEKIQELLKNYFVEYLYSTTEDFDYEMMKRNFGEDIPSIKELDKRVQMLMLNEHPLWADNHPVPPNMLYIGGVHHPPEPEISKELKTFLDSSKNGVIYISFGTNVKPSILPPEKIRIMTKVLSELPYDVLWKWDNDELPGKSDNIRIYKWFPQPTLLKHPNVKLFITQGGLQSSDEAINAAVPLLGIPMIADQWYNVEKYVHHKIGLKLEITDLNEKDFKHAIKRLIEDKSFKENMLRMRSLTREHPIDPLNLAVWWIEHILEFGGEHLKSPAAGLSWAEYYEIKLIAALLGLLTSVIAIIVIGVILGLRLCCRLFGNSQKVSKGKKKN